MELNSKNIKKILLVIFLGAVIFTAVQKVGRIWDIVGSFFSLISPLIAALCIAFVLNVLLCALENKVFFFMDRSKSRFVLALKRPICLALTYILAFGVIAILIFVIIPDIVDTVVYLAEKLPSFVVGITDWVEGLLLKFNIKVDALPGERINWVLVANTIKDWFSGSEAKIFGDAVNITTALFSGIFDTFLSLVISVYILAQKEKIGAFLRRVAEAFLPQNITHIVYHVCSKSAATFSRFIGGQLIEALILGTLCCIGMLIFGFPNAFIISVLVTVTALVPIVGATIGVVAGAFLICITSPIKALLFVVFFLILQQLEGNFIYPKVVGKAVGLPGVLVVSAVLVGGNLGGVLGALLAVPTCAVLYATLKEYVDYCHSKKEKEGPITEAE